jgi:Holliday junction resolvase RusA-like endonuclease
MSSINFVIEGKPFGKKSVRTTRKGWSYMPKENTNYKSKVQTAYKEKYGDFSYKRNKPLYVEITAKFEMPKSASKKNMQLMMNGLILPTVKPDSDNIVKMVLDSLNGVAFDDDKQVVLHVCRKIYGIKPEVIVFITDEVFVN